MNLSHSVTLKVRCEGLSNKAKRILFFVQKSAPILVHLGTKKTNQPLTDSAELVLSYTNDACSTRWVKEGVYPQHARSIFHVSERAHRI